jgi:hypothetical protein
MRHGNGLLATMLSVKLTRGKVICKNLFLLQSICANKRSMSSSITHIRQQNLPLLTSPSSLTTCHAPVAPRDINHPSPSAHLLVKDVEHIFAAHSNGAEGSLQLDGIYAVILEVETRRHSYSQHL